MSDIVDRLRHVSWLAEEGSEVVDLAATAADEIVRLRNQLDAARTGRALLALEAERNLSDQLAEALRAEVRLHDLYGDYPTDWAKGALAAYDAARKEPQ